MTVRSPETSVSNLISISKVKKTILAALFCLMDVCIAMQAQKYSLSTNLMDYLNLGTMNIEGSVALSRHWTFNAGARYNPFTFREGDADKQFQSRQQTYFAGCRGWLWHVHSGWWFAGKIQYQEYNTGGIVSRRTEEGDRYGAGVTAGYSHMLNKHLNLEFGLGLWGGVKQYTVYSCPKCGFTEDSGVKTFVMPNDVSISLSYVF